jgi:hypothetical protein
MRQLPTPKATFRPTYRGYIFGEVHVRACFFIGRCGTSNVSADEAQRNLVNRTECGALYGAVDAATTDEVWS